MKVKIVPKTNNEATIELYNEHDSKIGEIEIDAYLNGIIIRTRKETTIQVDDFRDFQADLRVLKNAKFKTSKIAIIF